MRPHWFHATVITVVGAVVLAVSYFTSPFTQSILINLGSALLLFALLTIAAPSMVKAAIGDSLRLRTLTDAQAALRAEFSRAASANKSVDRQVKDCVDGIGRTLHDAGFRQRIPSAALNAARSDPAGQDQCLVYRGPAELSIEWKLSWANGELKHVLTVPGRGAGEPSRSRTERVEYRGDAVSTRVSLVKFEEYVYVLMRDLAIAIAAGSKLPGSKPVERQPQQVA